MRILTTLMLLAATFTEVPAIAQMTLPQQRMIESMRDVDSLNRGMEAAQHAAKSNQDDENNVNYARIGVLAGALWLYIRRRRGAQASGSPR